MAEMANGEREVLENGAEREGEAPVRVALGSAGDAHINKIRADEPWRWLAAGWADLWAMPFYSLCYGAGFAALSFLIVGGMFAAQWGPIALALGAGFMLLGPLLAMGLYEASRRREAGEALSLKAVFFVRAEAPSQLAFLAFVLSLLLLVWMRVALLLFALFFGSQVMPSLENFLPTLLFTPHGLGLLIVGSALGGVFAVFCFSISVVSVPMLLVRDVDSLSAMHLSFRSVQENFWPMMLWGWIITLVTMVGMATFMVGMIVAFPLIGHASWHAYRGLIQANQPPQAE